MEGPLPNQDDESEGSGVHEGVSDLDEWWHRRGSGDGSGNESHEDHECRESHASYGGYDGEADGSSVGGGAIDWRAVHLHPGPRATCIFGPSRTRCEGGQEQRPLAKKVLAWRGRSWRG